MPIRVDFRTEEIGVWEGRDVGEALALAGWLVGRREDFQGRLTQDSARRGGAHVKSVENGSPLADTEALA